jgi:hypothetical protein
MRVGNLAELFKSIAPGELRQLAQLPSFRQFAALLYKTGLFPGGGSSGGDPVSGLPLDHGNPSQITGILPDQHHGQVHGLDTTNHTGTLPESKLSLDYPTHPQAHDLNSSDHTGTLPEAKLTLNFPTHARQHAADASADHTFPHLGGTTWWDDEGNWSAPAGARIFIGPTAPPSPLPGDLWIKTA